MYIHIESSRVITDLLDVANQHRVIVDIPMGFTNTNELWVLVGNSDALRDALVAAPQTRKSPYEDIETKLDCTSKPVGEHLSREPPSERSSRMTFKSPSEGRKPVRSRRHR